MDYSGYTFRVNSVIDLLRSRRVGLAFGGGSVRGLAHIGVIKALTEIGIRPAVIAGTSVGSIVGAAVANRLEWYDIAAMARSVFWPSLLNGDRLVRFCEKYFPATFAQLSLPFAALATSIPSKQVMMITEGDLPSAISASCALRVIRRTVERAGQRLKDGGIVCVLPAIACRALGADFVISSDVWELSSLLRGFGFDHATERGQRVYPTHFREAVHHTDLLIQPAIPTSIYIPSASAVERMIKVGEQAARLSFARWAEAETQRCGESNRVALK
jgi:NTE family protein